VPLRKPKMTAARRFQAHICWRQVAKGCESSNATDDSWMDEIDTCRQTRGISQCPYVEFEKLKKTQIFFFKKKKLNIVDCESIFCVIFLIICEELKKKILIDLVVAVNRS
jgi:hypothetical protein